MQPPSPVIKQTNKTNALFRWLPGQAGHKTPQNQSVWHMHRNTYTALERFTTPDVFHVYKRNVFPTCGNTGVLSHLPPQTTVIAKFNVY